MGFLKKLAVLSFCFIIVLVNTACPFRFGSPQQSLSDIEFSLMLTAKGMVLCWFVYGPVKWIDKATVQVPSGIDFMGFPSNPGFFGIDTNFDGKLESGDFQFKLARQNANRSCVDFNGNSSCDSNEAFLDYDSGGRALRFSYSSPSGSALLDRGNYFLNLSPESYKLSTGISNFASDYSVELTASDPESATKNLIFLTNTQILPHVAFGVAGTLTLVVQILVNNPNGVAATAELEFFRQNGTAMEVKIGGRTSREHIFTVPAKSSVLVEIDPASGVQLGWAFAYGTQPLEFATIYSTFSGGTGASSLQGEAGISASTVGTAHVMSIVKTAAGFNTAFAIANPTSKTAKLTLIFKDSTNAERARKDLTLAARSQTAQFFDEFSGLTGSSFTGTLIVKSDADVAITSLRTLNGIQRSSLPGGTHRIG